MTTIYLNIANTLFSENKSFSDLIYLFMHQVKSIYTQDLMRYEKNQVKILPVSPTL